MSKRPLHARYNRRRTLRIRYKEICTSSKLVGRQWPHERKHFSCKSLNSFLDSLLSKAYSHQRQILNEGKEFTMAEFRNRWLGVSTERVYMLMEVFEERNAQMKALVGHEFSPLTLERYTTSKKHTHEFMKWKIGRA